jgi:uncharacterized membrane protein YeaQ/YmgE (transglycosylase-associated protein family)
LRSTIYSRIANPWKESGRVALVDPAMQGGQGAAFSGVWYQPSFFAMLPGSESGRKAEEKSMHLSDQGLLVILVVGIIAGWLAGKIVRGNGFGLVGDAAIGMVGALIGDWLLHRLGVHFGSGIIGLVINATIGAIVLLLPLRQMGASGWGRR